MPPAEVALQSACAFLTAPQHVRDHTPDKMANGRAGKLVGDKRAIVAEMGFDRPFNKILVAASGLL